MPDQLSTLYGDLLQGSYDCVDRVIVVRENIVAGEKPKNQQHPDRSSPGGAYEGRACNIVTKCLWGTF
jgi:hypothetical protein